MLPTAMEKKYFGLVRAIDTFKHVLLCNFPCSKKHSAEGGSSIAGLYRNSDLFVAGTRLHLTLHVCQCIAFSLGNNWGLPIWITSLYLVQLSRSHSEEACLKSDFGSEAKIGTVAIAALIKALT
ncbi:hypothetical protein K7X08_034819 [Anisodus acutangulus]|uniref:Uncharacterized protein n=1 Tax=Anisodus acutangulus TaxID=402998 RepID=A0A9Q1R202_9SOLA|nr:hypothetical protein K7X08_034819 [Anisodus acutangulus]